MCYRNNTLLSTSAGRSLRERKKYMNWSPAEKEERCQKILSIMDFTYTPRNALHPEKINKYNFRTVQCFFFVLLSLFRAW